MAANPAVLAAQYAAGVPVPPRFQLGRNLVTKSSKTTVMAASPAPTGKYEASVLAFAPCQLRRNSVTKRVKTITAAYPIPEQYSTDIPEYTNLEVTNNSGQKLKLSFKNFWEGLQTAIGTLPDEFKEIENEKTGNFKHEADARSSVIGSAGGLEYKIEGEGNLKWIIAWSNSKNELNKVYSKIVKGDDTVDWDEIKSNLRKSGKHHEAKEGVFSFDVEIDATSATPAMKAKLDVES